MKIVYHAQNIIDAHLVRGMLESYGIPALVSGDHLAGGIGELPAIGLITVKVPEAAELEAKAIVDEFEKGAVEIQLNDMDGAEPELI